MNRLLTQINNIKTWWSNNKNDVWRLRRRLNRFARNIAILMIIGIILNLVDSCSYHDFSARFPAIYGWFDGWLQLGEFVIKALIKGIYSLFTGHWSMFQTECNEAFQELLSQFAKWLNTLQFWKKQFVFIWNLSVITGRFLDF